MENTEESLFDNALARYRSGVSAGDVIEDFEALAKASPNDSACCPENTRPSALRLLSFGSLLRR